MQYHLNGFRSGDPAVAEAVVTDGARPAAVDVLIVGCGPAGLTLAAQLSAFPEITTRITERKPGPLEVGQADGIACRSVEMFEAFGFADKVMAESYWVNEVAFWRPGADGTGLQRADRIRDVEDDLSEMPHVILSQARVHDFYLEVMRNGPHRLQPDYSRDLTHLRVTDDPDYPVEATFACLDREGAVEVIRARHVVGCDGARSVVRREMGHALKGDSARQLWGVMDVLCITDFPDIRLKAAIQSAAHGSILIIPREGGYMVRMYIELDALQGEERAADRNVTAEMLIQKARAILAPYTLEVAEVAWWSAYEIGQRVCDAFDDVPEGARGVQVPRLFIAGDACHTHSPKAGQGMNVSMADTFNLGWKLAAVLRGQAEAALLDTYSAERQAKAKELIDFDKDMARLFSAKPRTTEEAALFQAYFKRHGRYTAGVETRYAPSLLVGDGAHQALAKGYPVGMRFHSAPVIRLADARPLHLGHVIRADGRWRLIAFAEAGDMGHADGGVGRLCAALLEGQGLVRRYTPAGADPDHVFDLRAVFQAGHREMRIEALAPGLVPRKGRFGLIDHEKVFCPDVTSGPDIFDLRRIDRARGALVVVRPDQFVAQVLPLEGVAALSSFFDGFMRPA
ncbi:MAG: phenol 2-monooxygenase [Rhodobacterales bacterium 34-62-10]|nr:MAG: phenol 2-monooxygenase [Rhodobacterales bacterium 34-62-10]